MDESCLFCKIVAGTIPATTVYRDSRITAFLDIQPQAPVHVLVIPNEHIASTNDLTEDHTELIGYLLRMVQVVARGQGVAESGYRLIVNTGQDAQQSVAHIHVHILGGRHLGWPPG